MEKQPLISIIVPVHNGGKFLERCLDALLESTYSAQEIIVVDDASLDHSAEISRQKGVKVLQLPQQSGPAAARNLGAKEAQGEILFFVDADVLVQRETVTRAAASFRENPGIAAVFGSYDDNPAEKNFISQYKNLYHHFVHQQSSHEAVTFWAGCGAIRREVFHAIGGFDQTRYPRPSIEDIELGYRMRRAGYQILLDKKLQVKHLKRWTLKGLLQADIFYRAVPWSKLILERQQMVNDLNLRTSDRVSAGMVGLSLGLLPLSIYYPPLFLGIALLLFIVFLLNRKIYTFFYKRRGLGFAILAFPMQVLYYFYSGVTFVLCWGLYVLFGKRTSEMEQEAGAYKGAS